MLDPKTIEQRMAEREAKAKQQIEEQRGREKLQRDRLNAMADVYKGLEKVAYADKVKEEDEIEDTMSNIDDIIAELEKDIAKNGVPKKDDVPVFGGRFMKKEETKLDKTMRILNAKKRSVEMGLNLTRNKERQDALIIEYKKLDLYIARLQRAIKLNS